MDKYEIIQDGENKGRIKALRSFGNVKEGDIGGFVDCENNLSHDDDCWVYDDAVVHGKANVYGNAVVYDNARVYGKAEVSDKANVYGNAIVHDDAIVYGSAKIYDDAMVYGKALVYDDAVVYDNARVCGKANVSDDAMVYGKALVYDDAIVYGSAKIYDDAMVCGSARIYGNALVYGKANVFGKANVSDDAIVHGNEYEEKKDIEKTECQMYADCTKADLIDIIKDLQAEPAEKQVNIRCLEGKMSELYAIAETLLDSIYESDLNDIQKLRTLLNLYTDLGQDLGFDADLLEHIACDVIDENCVDCED